MASICSAAPAGRRAASSSRGAKVRRAGALTEVNRYCRKTSPYSSHTLPRPANAWAASAAETAVRQLVVTSTSRRRSTESISGPPNRPTTIAGTAAASPTPPTAAEDPGSRYTCRATANVVICPPTEDTTVPANSRAKSGERRSGRTSISSRRPERAGGGTAADSSSGRGPRRAGRPGRLPQGDGVPPAVRVVRAAVLQVDQRVPQLGGDRAGGAVAGGHLAAGPLERADRRDDRGGAAGEHLRDPA